MRCPRCAEESPDGTIVCPYCGGLTAPLPPTPTVRGVIFRFAAPNHLLGSTIKRGGFGISMSPLKTLAWGIWSREAAAAGDVAAGGRTQVEPDEAFEATGTGFLRASARFRELEPVFWTNVDAPGCPKCGKAMAPLGWMLPGAMAPTVLTRDDPAAIDALPRDPMYTFRCKKCNLETMQ